MPRPRASRSARLVGHPPAAATKAKNRPSVTVHLPGCRLGHHRRLIVAMRSRSRCASPRCARSDARARRSPACRRCRARPRAQMIGQCAPADSPMQSRTRQARARVGGQVDHAQFLPGPRALVRLRPYGQPGRLSPCSGTARRQYRPRAHVAAARAPLPDSSNMWRHRQPPGIQLRQLVKAQQRVRNAARPRPQSPLSLPASCCVVARPRPKRPRAARSFCPISRVAHKMHAAPVCVGRPGEQRPRSWAQLAANSKA